MTHPKATDLAPTTPQPLTQPATPVQSQNIATQLVEMSRDKSIDVAKLGELWKMQREMEAEEKRTAYRAALARVQSGLEQMKKSGVITTPSGRVSKFLRLEDIDNAIKPFLRDEGFAFSFDQEPGPGNSVTFVAELMHREGWSEKKRLTVPIDTGAGRNAIQSMGSSVSYARRYLIEMHLNIVRKGDDDDGNGGPRPLTTDQLQTLKEELDLNGVPEAEFLRVYGGTWDGLNEKVYTAALGMIRKSGERRKKGGGQ
jgi:hypothetical protein